MRIVTDNALDWPVDIGFPVAGGQVKTARVTFKLKFALDEASLAMKVSDFVVGWDGTQLGAVTNDQGQYRINAEAGTYTLRATRIGFQPDSATAVVVTAGGTATANFRLTPAATMLTAVVAIGYG